MLASLSFCTTSRLGRRSTRRPEHKAPGARDWLAGSTRCSHWGRGMGPGRGVIWKRAVRGKAVRACIRKWRARGLLARWGIMQVRRRRHSYVHPTTMHYRTVLRRIRGARHPVGEMLLCL